MAEMNWLSRWFVNHAKARVNARLFAWLQANLNLPPDAVCLEVGCGNGNMALRIMDGMRPARLVATDLDLAQIEAAERRFREHYPQGVPAGLEVRPADMLRLPFPDGGFDVVFAFATLHHAGATHGDPSRLADALGEVDRVLEPSGLLAYEEFLHKDRLHAWLAAHGYAIPASKRHWRWEWVVAQKPAAPGAPTAPPAAPARPP